jgi:hypothetical protein
MIRAALLLLGVAIAGPAAAAPASVTIGGLVLDYDDAEWQATVRPGGAVLQTPGCGRIVCEDRMGIFISMAPASGPFPTDIPVSEVGFVKPLWDLLHRPLPWPGEGAVRQVNGFAIFASDRWSGCRALSPSELTAILDHAGTRYTFASGIAAACGGVWGVDRDAFVDVLAGLRPLD